jgi:hypothetical protein
LISRRKSARLLVFCSVAALAAAACSLLWALSSFDLAFLACNGTYSLHASNVRCQRPVFLILAFLVFAAVGVALGILAFVRARHRNVSI